MFGRAIETLLMTNKKLRLDTTHGIAGRSTDFNMEEEKVDGRQMVKLLTDVGGLENRDSVCQKWDMNIFNSKLCKIQNDQKPVQQ